jgi:hypothetical protein
MMSLGCWSDTTDLKLSNPAIFIVKAQFSLWSQGNSFLRSRPCITIAWGLSPIHRVGAAPGKNKSDHFGPERERRILRAGTRKIMEHFL